MHHSTWGQRVARFSTSPIFKKLAAVVTFFVIYSALECAFEVYYLGYDLEFPAGVHTLLGVTLSILLVFRTNSTYDRWWEGRKWWGALTNNSRSLAQVVCALPLDESDKQKFAELQRSLPFVFRDHLRELTPPRPNQPVLVTAQMARFAQQWLDAGQISPQQWSSLELRLSAYMDIIGACERIRRTPLPLSHRAAIPQALVTYLLVLPWGMPDTWGTPIVVGVVAYFMMGIEFIAEALEEPFGYDPDDLPLSTYADNIAGSLEQIYGEMILKSLPSPVEEKA